MFAFLVLFSSLLIESIGTYVSVVGLSSLFAANPVIITLAMALDLGKIVCVSFLYRHWKHINIVMKSYMLIASAVLIVITSAGAFGYLSSQFQKAISDTNEAGIMITSLTDEQSRLQKRKEEIDAQIAKLPDNSVRGRTSLIKQFAPEVERINLRLADIDAELPKLKIETVKKNVEVGPIIYIAQAFNTSPEQAVKWVIMVIIFVFDPLAIVLLLAGNYLLELQRKEKEKQLTSRVILDVRELTAKASEKLRGIIPKKKVVESQTAQTAEAIKNLDGVNIEFANIEASDEVTGIIVPAVPAIIPEEKIQELVSSPAVQATVAQQLEPEQIETVQISEELESTDEKIEQREIITLDQITGHEKIHRSLLEDINTKSDVIFNSVIDAPPIDRVLMKKYDDKD